MKLKVCGLRDSANISSIAAVGPDYMGFIFYAKSPRFVQELPQNLVPELRKIQIEPVAVFVNEDLSTIMKIVKFHGFRHIQLHGQETPETCALLRSQGFKVIKSFSIAEPSDLQACPKYEDYCDFFLFDSKTPLHGGSGKHFDWKILQEYDGKTPFFLSGGIGPDDVEPIMAFYHPKLECIDINSRFETKPSIKDVNLVKFFKDQLNKYFMQNRINKLFETKQSEILSIYFTAGYPKPDDTMPVLRELQKAGVDMVEIGVPFSDPMADGPVIQKSGNESLKNGMTLNKLFSQLEGMRKEIKIPVILMGYLNVIMQFGLEAFCRKCRETGVDGVILPDLPMKDYLEEYKPVMDKYGLSMVLLVTPETSDERIREIDDNTNSFIYIVSSASITGAQNSFNDAKQAYFRRIRDMQLKNPCMIGFGISNKQTLDSAFENASGAIIGSRFIECLGNEKTIAGAVDSLLQGLN
jgi:tryptophan synthase alpha subunit